MNRLVVPLMAMFVLILASCSTDTELSEADGQRYLAHGKSVLMPFKKQLKGALKQGLASGPDAAIAACNMRAPEIVSELGQQGIVGRSSHKLRNPDNAAKPWMQPIIEAYQKPDSSKEPVLVPLGDDRYGYAEAIELKPMCVMCHGDPIGGEIKQRLTELYPQDQAIGFKPGDFRGIFWTEFSAAAVQ